MNIQRRFLLGSRWTAVVPLDGGERHVEAVEAPRGPMLTVRAILTARRYSIAVAELEDPSRWSAGWTRL